MAEDTELMVDGRRPGVPVWNLTAAIVLPDRIEARFIDGCVRVTSRTELLNALPADMARDITEPAKFAEGRFDDDLGTVVWPNGADIAPEFLRWGPHLEKDCPCGHQEC